MIIMSEFKGKCYFFKGDSSVIFLSPFEWGLLYMVRICSLWKQILPYRLDPLRRYLFKHLFHV